MIRRRLVVVVVLVLAAVNLLAIVVLGSPPDGCPGYGSYSGSGFSPTRAGANGYSGYSSGYFCSEADLKLGITDHPDPALAGGTVSYRASVLNKGPDVAFDVFVSHSFDRDSRVLSVDAPESAECEIYDSYVYCTIGLVRVGRHADVTVTVSLPPTKNASTDFGYTYSDAFDPNFSDNHETEQTTIAPSADLSVTKLDSPDPVGVGDPLTYSLLVRNRGPARATAVTLTDPLPVGLNVVSVSSTQGSCAVEGTVVTCDIGTMNKNGVTIVTIVATPLGPGLLTNAATVTSTMSDPLLPNNRAEQVTEVVA